MTHTTTENDDNNGKESRYRKITDLQMFIEENKK